MSTPSEDIEKLTTNLKSIYASLPADPKLELLSEMAEITSLEKDYLKKMKVSIEDTLKKLQEGARL